MRLNEHATRAYNQKADTLLQYLTIRPTTPVPGSGQGFMPDVHVVAKIPMQDISEIRMSRPDREGNEAGKLFYHEGKAVEIAGEGYQILKRIAEGMQKAPDLQMSVSIKLLVTLIFDWVAQRYKQSTIQPMTEYVLSESHKEIQRFEVWIPIASTRIQSEFEFGNMKIKSITRGMLDTWEAEFRQKHPEESSGPDVFFERWRKAVLGLAAATMGLTAEPERAYELASSEADKTIAMLRCLSPYNCFPFVVSYSVPLGQERARSFRYFMMQRDQIVMSSSGLEHTPLDEWRIDDEYLSEMKSFGMETLSDLLKEKKPSPFQKDVLHALQLYARSSTCREPGDKLTYILAPLEALLLVDRVQTPDDMADRLAMLVDKSPLGRKEALATIRAVYDRRLDFVYGEHSRADMQILEKFMGIAWTFFTNAAGYAMKYKTKADFIKAIDYLKLSGGLNEI